MIWKEATETRVAVLFRLTAFAILAQIALGGLLTFDFINPLPHVAAGVVVFGLSIVTAFVALRSKPDKQLKQVSVTLIVALVVQITLGFMTLAIGSHVVAWIHLVLGVLIYAMALSGMSFASRQEFMSNGRLTTNPHSSSIRAMKY